MSRGTKRQFQEDPGVGQPVSEVAKSRRFRPGEGANQARRQKVMRLITLLVIGSDIVARVTREDDCSARTVWRDIAVCRELLADNAKHELPYLREESSAASRKLFQLAVSEKNYGAAAAAQREFNRVNGLYIAPTPAEGTVGSWAMTSAERRAALGEQLLKAMLAKIDKPVIDVIPVNGKGTDY